MSVDKKWAILFAAGQLAVSCGGVAVAVVASGRVARTEAREETRGIARDVVREEWLTRLEAETKRIAADAASTAADRAVREAVMPWVVQQASHKSADDQRQRETERRITNLEDRGLGPWERRH